MGDKYQAYPEYKNSGVEWIGEYPLNWNLTRVKFESYVKARVGWHGLKSEDFTDEGPFLITGSDFRGPVINWNECYHCDLARYEQDPYIQLKDGDLLITKDGTIGKVALVSGLAGKATLNSGVFVVRPLTNNYTSRFYFWLLQASVFTGFVDFNKTGSTIVHLYQDTFVNFKYAIPSFNEQLTIANFLDHETAKIDTLIEKQQQLIKLLKEKRQAVISHAVTKGLNPNAKMRDSGVEWLGEVPEHWSMKIKLVSVAEGSRGSFVNGPFGSDLLSLELQDVGVPVIYIRDLKQTGYMRKSAVCVTEEKARQLEICKVVSGDVLIAKVGDPPGEACIYPENEPAAIITQDVIRIRVNRGVINPYYLVMLLNSDLGKVVVDNISIESTRKRISLGDFKQVRFIIPSLSEQSDIVSFVELRCRKIDTLIAKAQSMVSLIIERRTALISAAVTGKIDVRDWQPPNG